MTWHINKVIHSFIHSFIQGLNFHVKLQLTQVTVLLVWQYEQKLMKDLAGESWWELALMTVFFNSHRLSKGVAKVEKTLDDSQEKF